MIRPDLLGALRKVAGRPAAIAAVALVLAAAVGLVALSRRRAPAPAGASGGVAVDGRGGPRTVALDVPADPALPALWLDVHEPRKAWAALERNPWAKRAVAAPLGEGLLGAWAGVLGARGEDLGGAFRGALAGLAAEKLLGGPFRIVWYGGPSAAGTPALVVPGPGHTAKAAFAALDASLRRGAVTADRCPGPAPSEREKGAAPEKPRFEIARWALAEQPVFAAAAGDRLVLARRPLPVLQALCALPAPAERARGVDLDLSFSRAGFGREGQLFAELLGLGGTPRLAFALEGDTLVPRGLAAEVARPHLAVAAAPGELLRLAPEDAGVVVTLALRLPAALSRDSLRAFFREGATGETAVRSVLLVWNPRGDERRATEVAVAFHGSGDRAALREVFSGRNPARNRALCGAEVFASSDELLARMAAACEGKAPSILDAHAAVAAGMRAPSSVAIGLNAGRLLSRLVSDAWAAEAAKAAPPPPEVGEAERLLEELPFLGLTGSAAEKVLVPGGFRS